MIPQSRGAAEKPGQQQQQEDGLDAANLKLDALLHLKDLPRGPALPPRKKAPQFMLDLFNAVSVSDGILRSQKDILEGNIVRSFEDKGEQRFLI